VALKIGQLLGDVLSAGGTYFKRQKKAKKKEAESRDLIRQNTEMAQGLFDRDLGQSNWANVQSDPRMRQAQMGALDRLGNISREGFTAEDRGALNQAFMQSRAEEQSQRGAALQAAARRGDVSGGNALMGALAAQQGGANRAAQHATDVGLAGRDRALRALEGYSQQAGQMRGQDFGEQAARANGLDSFTQWATGQKSADAGMLANARLGQSQSLANQAAQMRDSSNIEAVGQAVLTAYGGGAAGAVGGAGGAPVSQEEAYRNHMSQYGGGFGSGSY
jgi:hypothetical protein